MANTVDTTLAPGWNLIAGPDTTGTVSIKGSGAALVNEQSALPVAEDESGHRIVEEHPPLGFFMKAGQSLYAKAILGNFTLVVTLD